GELGRIDRGFIESGTPIDGNAKRQRPDLKVIAIGNFGRAVNCLVVEAGTMGKVMDDYLAITPMDRAVPLAHCRTGLPKLGCWIAPDNKRAGSNRDRLAAMAARNDREIGLHGSILSWTTPRSVRTKQKDWANACERDRQAQGLAAAKRMPQELLRAFSL